jgi:D-amino-acid dehydrogenase
MSTLHEEKIRWRSDAEIEYLIKEIKAGRASYKELGVPPRVAVVGGGIVGLFVAYYLMRAGSEVRIFEQTNMMDTCSHGNAGMIVPSHIVPLTSPGFLKKGLKMLFDPHGPFGIDPQFNFMYYDWFKGFARSCNDRYVQKSIPVLRDFCLYSKQLYQEFVARNEVHFEWKEQGLLMLYRTPEAAREMLHEAEIANKAGVEAKVLSAQEVQDMEPNTRVDVLGGVFYPNDAHINPTRLYWGLLNWLKWNGVEVWEKSNIYEITSLSFGVELVGNNFVGIYDKVVLATGAWCPNIIEELDFILPILGGKGYSFTQRGIVDKVKTPAIMVEARSTITPFDHGTRFAGSMYMTRPESWAIPQEKIPLKRIDMKRVGRIHQAVNQYYPELDVPKPTIDDVWEGYRPLAPDGLPFIGRVRGTDDIFVAVGHGMMGMTLAPATGKIISELIYEQSLSFNIDAFSPSRFDPKRLRN